MYEWGSLPVDIDEKFDENFDEFYSAYIKNIRNISATTMLKMDGEIDEDLLDSDICWMTTSNMIHMLTNEKIIDIFNKEINGKYKSFGDVQKMVEFVYDHLYKNNLLTVATGGTVNGGDHHSAVIGINGLAYLIEYAGNKCQRFEVFNIDDYVLYLVGVRLGKVAERFYGKTVPTVISIYAYNRIPVNAKVVTDYLNFNS